MRLQAGEYPELRYEQKDLSRWWEVFNDPELSSLIIRSRQNNLDIMTALARVKEARAALGVVSSDLYPSVDADGSVDWGKQSENVNPLATSEQTVYSLAADAGWEIDLFGRIRRSIEAATADYQATREDHNDILITVLAETAATYLQMRTLQAQLATSRKNIESQRAMLELTRIRYKYGLATYLDVAQATQVLTNTEADLPTIRTGLAQSITSLSVLTGESSAALQKELQTVVQIPLPPAEVAVGIPADRLRQRPDIRKAERQLAAQTARVGVATADLYPTFSLTGNLGLASLDTGNFFDSNSGVYGIGPSFSWNIFDMGKIRQQIAVQDARTEQLLHAYELTMLRAIKEVEDRLKAYHEQRIRMNALQHSVAASRETLDMSTKLYKDGLTGFQDVLDAQRSLLVAESALDEARGNTGIQLVGLYKALAGGWNTEQADTAVVH
jgi:NodT family efflux transporter outer membrane factor (OMF) lipoprotein